jgi:hypothetical protein
MMYVDISLSFSLSKTHSAASPYVNLLLVYQHSPDLPMVNVMVSKEVYQAESGKSPDAHVIS